MGNISSIGLRGNEKPGTGGVSFTKVSSSDGRLTKAYALDRSGALKAKPAPPLSRGTATRIELKGEPSAMADALAQHLRSIGSDKAIIPAPPPAGLEHWTLVTKPEIGERRDVIARTSEYFKAPIGPALFALDLDFKDYPQSIRAKLQAGGGLSAVLASVFPGFAGAACVTRPSASNGIENEVTGEKTENQGQHRYFFIRDGLDAEGFAKRLAARLTLAGYGFGVVSKAGLVLHRTLIDAAASSDPSRLFYEANADLGEGLKHVKDARKPIVKAGGFLDTRALPPLGEEESARLVEIRATIERDLAPACKKQKEHWKAQRVADMVRKGKSREAALKAVSGAVERHSLSGDFEIVLDEGPAVTARDILADPAGFHKKTCADPLEPEYGGGRNLAVIYTDHPPFRIRSQAHGGIDYRLEFTPEDWFEPISAEGDAAAQAQADALAKADALRTLFDAGAPGASREAFDFEAAGRLSVDALRSIAPPQFVLGTRFQPGVVTLGIGAPGVSKTTFAILSALSIATGKPLTQERVAKTGRVLVASNEDGRDVLLRRIAGVANVYNLDMRRVVEQVAVLSGVDDRRLVFAERSEPRGPVKPGRDLAAFTAYVREKGFVHVVLDPLISLHRGLEENSAADMEQLGDFLRDFARAAGVSLDLLHHSIRNRDKNTEAGAGRADSMRGSSAIEGFVRSAYTLRAMGIDTAKELNLSPDRATQMVRLDDAKRNYGRRVAREQWFELVSVLPTGERVSPADFLATADDAAAKRANASVGVHMLFDASRERARARIAAAGDKQGRKDAIRSYIALSMTEDTCDQQELVAGFAVEEAKSESRARVEITDAIPTGRRGAARVAAAGQEWFLWREERRSGNSKRVICREATGRIVPPEIAVQAELGAAGNSFEDLFG